MRLASAWLSTSHRKGPQQLLIGSLAVLLTQVFPLSRPVQATSPHPTATRIQTSGVSQGTLARGQSVFALLQQAGVSASEVVQLQVITAISPAEEHCIYSANSSWQLSTSVSRTRRYPSANVNRSRITHPRTNSSNLLLDEKRTRSLGG